MTAASLHSTYMPATLSEKAKGKQKALDAPPDATNNVGPSIPRPQARELVIRFTEGVADLTVSVEQRDTVRDVKKKICTERPDLKDRRLRLIHSGRLLTDGTFLSSWLQSLEERQRRATTEKDSAVTSGSTTQNGLTWVHCSIGPKLEPGELQEESEDQTGQLQPARGFDRLSSVGFSPEDIAQFRRQFHSQASTNLLDLDFATEEEYDEHARALEEQWIDSIDDAGTAAISQSSSPASSTILQGILLGFFFPIIPFFFMKKTKPPVFWEDGSEHEAPRTVIFSRRMQMGLVVGFLINILFGLWRYLLDSS